jgi:hypothetical protein
MKEGPSRLEPSLEALIMQLATQVLVELGQVPNPVSGKPTVHPERAAYALGLLEVLQEKTQDHRTSREDELLRSVLSRLSALSDSVTASD